MKIRPIVFLVLIWPLAGKAQYFQYSQYNFTHQRINPAMVASSDFATAGFIFRDQNTGASEIALKTSMMSVEYPFLNGETGKRWSGLGLTLMDDRSGGIFAVQEASVSYAVNMFLSRLQFLSLGFKGLYQQRRVNLNGLYTGAQYIGDRGFDESLFNGESFGLLRSRFATFSAGLYWQQNDPEGRPLAWWGISFFDLNKPQDSFSGIDDELNSTFVASGGLRFEGKILSFLPQFLLTRSSAKNVLNVGVTTSYEVRPYPNRVAGRVDVITNYVPGRSVILGAQFHRETFSVGFSYDVPSGMKNPANRGAFEVALQLRRLVDPVIRNRTTRRKRNLTPARKDNAEVAKKTQHKETSQVTAVKPGQLTSKSVGDYLTDTRPVEHDLRTTLRQKADSVMASAQAGRLAHEPFVIDKLTLRFNFEFNSSNLDGQSMKYLDDLSAVLKENRHMRVRLTGHTDNIGSPSFNQRLSVYRANVVRQYLIARGVDGQRIQADGKGLTEPLNANGTEEERAVNRRVELVIYYQ